ncbi:hypothetical protein RUND412_002967 [Rhizina undulata]
MPDEVGCRGGGRPHRAGEPGRRAGEKTAAAALRSEVLIKDEPRTPLGVQLVGLLLLPRKQKVKAESSLPTAPPAPPTPSETRGQGRNSLPPASLLLRRKAPLPSHPPYSGKARSLVRDTPRPPRRSLHPSAHHRHRITRMEKIPRRSPFILAIPKVPLFR